MEQVPPRGLGGIMVIEFGYPVHGEYARLLEHQRQDLECSLCHLWFPGRGAREHPNFTGSLAWSFAENIEFGSYEN